MLYLVLKNHFRLVIKIANEKLYSSRLSQVSQSERISRLNRIHERLVWESTGGREHRLNVIRNLLTNETLEQRQHRLDVVNARIRTELPSQRTPRPAAVRERNYEMLSVENEDQRQNRLANMREDRRRNRFLGRIYLDFLEFHHQILIWFQWTWLQWNLENRPQLTEKSVNIHKKIYKVGYRTFSFFEVG
ncbi:hypothetical protein EVAR_76802_1 [Eumeta japonica]|uniref:Uncharacterized protein n=1 Tax=Eumeta variegata TaxID=151549 RepID=A0A4C1SVM9_EUMVA|nr:hypothetical protein EVAR_76802_1 [Eumeta japonica]